MTLREQLIAGVALVHLLLMSVFVFDLVRRQRLFLKKQNEEQAFNFVNGYALNSVPYIIGNDFDELERVTMSSRQFPNLKYAMVLSPEGIVLAHTDVSFIGKKPTDNVSLQLNNSTEAKILIEDEHVLDIASPILAEKKIVGWARTGIGQEFIQNSLATIIRDGILYILLALIIGTVIAVLIGNRLTSGLYKLVATADKVKSGDRNVRAAELNSLELIQLSTAFNQMLDDISENEKLLGLVVENMPVGIWILNEKGDVMSANSAGNKIWSGSPHVGISDYGVYKIWKPDTKEILAPEDYPAARSVTNGETVLNEELAIETFDGTHKIILNSALPLKDKDGKIIGAISINVDITEEKKITEQLALSESTLRNAFNFSAIGMSLVSPEGKFLRVNRQFCSMIGYTEQEMLASTFQDITYADDLDIDLAYLKQTLEGSIDSYNMDKRYYHRKGHLIWVHLTVSLVRDSQENPLFFVSQIEDISERKKAEALIRESEEKFRKLVEETLVGVFILQDEKFIYVNPQFERITGYKKSMLLNEMSFSDLIHQDHPDRLWKRYLLESSTKKKSGHYLLKAIKNDGTALQIEVILSPITFEDKPALIGTIIDITEQAEEEKRINKAVTDAQESERHQISMELHDNVKQLMAGCLLNIDFMNIIVKDEIITPIINNLKGYIKEAIEELRRISHQLAPSIDTSVSLEEKIKTVVNTMNVSNEVAINYYFEKSDEVLNGDVQLALYRIVQEQFTNILKHAHASSVDITLQRSNGDVRMLIEDNGVGFDTKARKNGIGLENIKRRVQVINGSLNIQAFPGEGCRLLVQIPVS